MFARSSITQPTVDYAFSAWPLLYSSRSCARYTSKSCFPIWFDALVTSVGGSSPMISPSCLCNSSSTLKDMQSASEILNKSNAAGCGSQVCTAAISN